MEYMKKNLFGLSGDYRELKAQESEVFQVSNDDTAVAQRRLEDKQPEEKTNMDCLVKEQEKEYQTGGEYQDGSLGLSKVFWAEETTMSTYLVTRSPSSAIGFKTPIDMLGLDDVTSKVVLYKNMGFNKSEEYKKTSLVLVKDGNETAFASLLSWGRLCAITESLTFNNTVCMTTEMAIKGVYTIGKPGVTEWSTRETGHKHLHMWINHKAAYMTLTTGGL
ncbi:hypothetical protein Tco_0167432 [Tanacetum coccineum]